MSRKGSNLQIGQEAEKYARIVTGGSRQERQEKVRTPGWVADRTSFSYTVCYKRRTFLRSNEHKPTPKTTTQEQNTTATQSSRQIRQHEGKNKARWQGENISREREKNRRRPDAAKISPKMAKDSGHRKRIRDRTG